MTEKDQKTNLISEKIKNDNYYDINNIFNNSVNNSSCINYNYFIESMKI